MRTYSELTALLAQCREQLGATCTPKNPEDYARRAHYERVFSTAHRVGCCMFGPASRLEIALENLDRALRGEKLFEERIA